MTITNLTVEGTDAIYLAGRDDVTVPLLNQNSSSFPLGRHGLVKQDFILETFPTAIATGDGQQFSFDASGKIDYFNGAEAATRGFEPDGGNGSSNLNSLAGISGYNGPIGSLVGVFLGNGNPLNTTPPSVLDFSSGGLGTNFTSLTPQLGQVFFIGDGVTGNGTSQTFTAPSGAARLFLGIADGFGFVGAPGAYEDNDGAFQVAIDTKCGVNRVGTSNNDTLLGTACDDTLKGLNAQDLLYGYAGNDLLNAGDGDDTIYAGDGRDTVLGGSAQDFLYGDGGNDRIDGGDGDDRMWGGSGNDSLTGGQGQDRIFGESGNDTLNGGTGDNTLTGGSGKDSFVLSKDGKNIIADFQDGQDLLKLTGGLTFAALSITQQGNDTRIALQSTNQDLALLTGVNTNLITSADFMI